ncbi:MAG: hypothetical protein Q4G68_06975 [Planctomycetia bacterium]|nr:hypothetical protein [Planctomycetia bacterium]
MKLRIYLLLIAIPLVCALGCGNRMKVYDVTGRITVNGESPGTELIITFTNPDNVTAQGLVSPDGTYTLSTLRKNDGAMEGEYRVLLRMARMEPPEESPDAASYFVPIDSKYEAATTSDLTANVVKGGENVFNFDVAPNPERRKPKK